MVGPWGAGKTHLWNRFAAKAATKTLYVSLFGCASIDDVRMTVAQNLATSGTVSLSARRAEGLKAIATAFDKTVGKVLGVDAVKLIANPLWFLREGMTVCLDDIERISPSLSPMEVLGFAETIAQQSDANVVLIYNDERIRGQEKDDFEAHVERVVLEVFRVEADVAMLAKSLGAGLLTPDESAVVAAIFQRAKFENVRTLKRVLSRVEYCKSAAGQHLPIQAVALLASLSIAKDCAKLEPASFYDIDEFVLYFRQDNRSRGRGQRPEAEDAAEVERDRRQLEFIKSCEVPRTPYRYYRSIYDLVNNGHVDSTALVRDLLPPPPRPQAVDEVLQAAAGRDLHFMTDAEYGELLSRVETTLCNNIDVDMSRLLVLVRISVVAARHTDGSARLDVIIESAERVAKKLAQQEASQPLDVVMYRGDDSCVFRIVQAYNRELTTAGSVRLAVFLEQSIGKGDLAAIREQLSANQVETLETLFSDRFAKLLVQMRRDFRREFLELMLTVSDLVGSGAAPNIGSKFRAFLKLQREHSTETSDRVRFEDMERTSKGT